MHFLQARLPLQNSKLSARTEERAADAAAMSVALSKLTYLAYSVKRHPLLCQRNEGVGSEIVSLHTAASSFRIAAMIATLPGLPTPRRRS